MNSLPQNIDAILFAKDAPLREEFKYLYASVFKHPETYVKLIETLGTKFAIYPTLITTYGLVPNSYSERVQSVVTLADLF